MNLLLDFDGRRLQGARPFAFFEAVGSSFQTRIHGQQPASGSGDVLAEIRGLLEYSAETHGTSGCAIGYFSYDFARVLEPRAFGSSLSNTTSSIPDVRLVFFEELVEKPVAATNESAHAASAEEPRTAGPEYLQAISQIQDYIAAGDIYQANYSQQFSAALSCTPSQLYERLRNSHAAPFAALLEWDDFAIASNSPERFLKLEDGVLTAQPIKGTAPRGCTKEEDATLSQQLKQSQKDRAENVMIVDLLRNDLGRVCKYGSIRVPQLFEVQTFPTLHHLVSTVTGVLAPDRDAVDAFAAAFPCGSITGAPKIRAMQIIDDLESTRRGASFGAVGYFGFDGDMEWNVAIRTITCQNGQAAFHAGGGIVADSDPESEHAEMRLKARALLQALAAPHSTAD